MNNLLINTLSTSIGCLRLGNIFSIIHLSQNCKSFNSSYMHKKCTKKCTKKCKSIISKR